MVGRNHLRSHHGVGPWHHASHEREFLAVQPITPEAEKDRECKEEPYTALNNSALHKIFCWASCGQPKDIAALNKRLLPLSFKNSLEVYGNCSRISAPRTPLLKMEQRYFLITCSSASAHTHSEKSFSVMSCPE